MQKTFSKKKKLEWLPLGDLHQSETYNIYEEQSYDANRSLELSLGKRGVEEPFTAIKKDDIRFIINGNRRYGIQFNQYGKDYVVPVWVIEEELSEDEIHWLILDLSRYRKKTYVDYITEYTLYDRLVPTNQGKKDSSVSRRGKTRTPCLLLWFQRKVKTDRERKELIST